MFALIIIRGREAASPHRQVVFSRRFSECDRYVRTKREPPLSKGGAERLRGGGIPAGSNG